MNRSATKRNSQALPSKIVDKSKSFSTDSDLIIRYVEKLNEVLETNKKLEEEIKEKNEVIFKIKRFPNKYITNIYCKKCEEVTCENEDLLKRFEISKRRGKYKREKNLEDKNKEDNYKVKLNKLYYIEKVNSVFIPLIGKEHYNKKVESNNQLTKENFIFEILKIKVNENDKKDSCQSKIPPISAIQLNLPNIPVINSMPPIPQMGNTISVTLVTNTNISFVPSLNKNIPSIPSFNKNITCVPSLNKIIPSIPSIPSSNTKLVPSVPNSSTKLIPSIPSTPGKNIPSFPLPISPLKPNVPLFGDLHTKSPNKQIIAPKLQSKVTKDLIRKKIQVRAIHNALLKNTYWLTWIEEIIIPKCLDGDIIDKYFAHEPKVVLKRHERRKSEIVLEKKLITLFDENRSRNLSIILSRFNISSSEMSRIVDNFETDSLQLNEIETLISMVPSIEEEKLLKDYKGDINDLSRPEKYCIKLISIPRCKERVKFIEFIAKFPDALSIVDEDLKLIKKCISVLKESKCIKQIFIICLAIVNYVNNTNIMGFSIESFNTLANYITNDKKSNLAKFLFNILSQNIPEINELKNEVSAIGASLNYTTTTDLNFITGGLSNITKEIEVLKTFEPSESIKSYYHNLMGFLEEYIDIVESIKKVYDEIKFSLSELTEKLGEKKTTKSKDILEPIYNFIKNFC